MTTVDCTDQIVCLLDRIRLNLLSWFGVLILLLVVANCPAVAFDRNVLIDISGPYPNVRFPIACRDGEILPVVPQTQAGEPLNTPYATFSGGEVQFVPFDANPPLRERYKSDPGCSGSLQTITVTFRGPASG